VWVSVSIARYRLNCAEVARLFTFSHGTRSSRTSQEKDTIIALQHGLHERAVRIQEQWVDCGRMKKEEEGRTQQLRSLFDRGGIWWGT
jgi:hypothetical protein